jgi:hypothetical protein
LGLLGEEDDAGSSGYRDLGVVKDALGFWKELGVERLDDARLQHGRFDAHRPVLQLDVQGHGAEVLEPPWTQTWHRIDAKLTPQRGETVRVRVPPFQAGQTPPMAPTAVLARATLLCQGMRDNATRVLNIVCAHLSRSPWLWSIL